MTGARAAAGKRSRGGRCKRVGAVWVKKNEYDQKLSCKVHDTFSARLRIRGHSPYRCKGLLSISTHANLTNLTTCMTSRLLPRSAPPASFGPGSFWLCCAYIARLSRSDMQYYLCMYVPQLLGRCHKQKVAPTGQAQLISLGQRLSLAGAGPCSAGSSTTAVAQTK